MNNPENQTPALGDPLLELEVMKKVAEQLQRLDEGGVRRVLRWAGEAFGMRPTGILPASPLPRYGIGPAESSAAGEGKYESVADFFAACSPSSEVDKALVIGYWTQVIQGSPEFDAQSINRVLKDLGYGVANITSAFDNLINRKPQFVIQTKKSGTSRQARKLYKLTVEGQRAVDRMIGGNQE